MVFLLGIPRLRNSRGVRIETWIQVLIIFKEISLCTFNFCRHPRISKEEKDLILISKGKLPFHPPTNPVITRSTSMDSSIVSDLDGSNIVYDDKEPIIVIEDSRKKPKIPLKAIFTSVPFYAILIAHCCQNWGFYTLLTEMPTYLKNILHFDIKTVNYLFFVYQSNY